MTNKNSNKIKVVTAVLLSIILIISPVLMILGITFVAPAQYSNTFFGALDAKYQRLTSIKENKLVVVGGSSVAFGLNSPLLEKYVGMPVVNFGLYADLGTKLMLELSRDHIKTGDIVILAPELDSQTLSSYFSWNNTLKAFDDDMSMLGELDFPIDDWLFSVGDFYKFASSKLTYMLDGTTPNPTDVYNSANFNEQGDIDSSKFPRVNNVMSNYYIPTEGYLVDLEPSIVDGDFLEYMNAYIRELKAKGAIVYFSWCPVNDLSLVDDSPEKRSEFQKFFEENLECDVISNIDRYIIDSKYFYDTNFHLNDAGATVRTLRLLDDIIKAIGKSGVIEVEETEPEAPLYKYAVEYYGPQDENTKYFVFEKQKNGAYKIIGLTEEGKRQKTLTVPLGYQGENDVCAYVINYMDTNIFEGSVCERLIIPENTNIGAMSGSFGGATYLQEMYIYVNDPGKFPPPSFSYIYSQNPSFAIHTPLTAGYREHYNWTPVNDSYPGIIIEDL